MTKETRKKRKNCRQRVTATFMSLLMLASMLPGRAALAQDTSTPVKHIQVKKGPTTVTIFRPQTELPEDPADADLTGARVFSERLIPAQSKTAAPEENRTFRNALLSFRAKRNPEDLSDLEEFIKQFPDSHWRPALELNMGELRFQTGYFTDALNMYKSAWEGLRNETGLEQKTTANEALSRLLYLNSRLGRKEEVQSLLKEAQSRTLLGSIEEKVEGAKSGLAVMNARPDCAYKCGPFALQLVLDKLGKAKTTHRVIAKAESTDRGTNLTQLKGWAKECGLDSEIARRSPGAPVLVPAIVHWKAGHFAAITGKFGNKYHVEDPTFFPDGNFWLSEKAIETEGDGYFLVTNSSLPDGWQTVSDAEGARVWGKGFGHARNEQAKTTEDPKECPSAACCSTNGMPQCYAWSMQATLNIVDTPVGYSPPLGPSMDFVANYNHIEANQPASPAFSTFGPDWSFNWVSYLTIDASQNLTVRVRGGGSEVYNFVQPDNVSHPYAPDLVSQAQMTYLGEDHYQRNLSDGSIEVFDQPDGTGRLFMTKVIDPQGNAATITYNANFRISTITDAIGQVTTLTYESNNVANVGYYKIKQIEDPFERTANFTWDTDKTHIVSITDVISLQSSFVYDPTSSFIQKMTTPYGITSFQHYIPENEGKDGSIRTNARGLRFGFPDQTSAVIESWIDRVSESYFWDRHAVDLHPGDPGAGAYTNCKTTKWLIDGLGPSAAATTVPDWIKPALENKIDFVYNGEEAVPPFDAEPDTHVYRVTPGMINKPNQVKRVTAGGDQIYEYEYNSLGKMIKSIDPIGRTFSYFYSGDNIDLLEIRETKGSNNFMLGKWIFNEKHLPTVYIDGSGQRTQYTYNSDGLVARVIDASTDVRSPNASTLTYDTAKNLIKVQGPFATDVTTITYDELNRVASVTDPQGYTVQYEYDLADRLTKTTYPDSTFEEMVYERLDLVATRDRNGRWTTTQYDSMDQVKRVTDPLGRKTDYTWCSCGSLVSLKDGAGNTTTWHHDLQGRVIEKEYADNTSVAFEYETELGRLKSRTDALNQKASYSYNLDDTLSQVSYTLNSVPISSTPTVNLTWDQNYRRITSVNNGTNLTYAYNPYTDPDSIYSVAKLTVGLTPQAGHILDIWISNSSLPSGESETSVTVPASPTLASTATAIQNALNSNSTLSTAGIKATASGADVSISAPLPIGLTTAYRSTSVTETIGGTVTIGNTISITAQDAALPGGTRTVSYTAKSGDTLTTIGSGLAKLILEDPAFANAQIFCSSGASIVLSSRSFNHTTYTQSVSPGATLTITQSNTPTESVVSTTTTTGGGKLAQANNTSIANSEINYFYDVLGRTVKRNIHDDASNKVMWTYDRTSRILGEANSLGTFFYTYADQATAPIKTGDPRLSSINYPNGQVTNFSYFGNPEDKRLQSIANLNPSGATFSQFDYQYNPAGEITKWQQQQNGLSLNYSLGYDLAGQLTTAQAGSGSVAEPFAKEFYYNYDMAANRTAVQQGSVDFLRIGGTKTTNDILTVTVFNTALSGGQRAINYTVPGTDTTLNDVAAGLAAAITADTTLLGIGVNAVSSGQVVKIRSISPNLTSYTKSTSGGATETLTFGISGNGVCNAVISGTPTTNDTLTITVNDASLPSGQQSVSYVVTGGDTLITAATALASAVTTALSAYGITATSGSVGTNGVVRIGSTSQNLTNYSSTTTGGGIQPTETITLMPNLNIPYLAAVRGTITNSDVVSIKIYDAGLPSGIQTISKTVTGSDTTTTIATALTTSISGNSNLQAAGITATSSGATITIQSKSTNLTSYRKSTNNGATETIILVPQRTGTQTAVIGGTAAMANQAIITVYDSGLAGGQLLKSYSAPGSVTPSAMATGLAGIINADTTLQAIGVSATSKNAVLNIVSTSVDETTYTKSSTGGVTVTLTPSVGVTQYSHNNVNELTSFAQGGQVRFQGSSSKPLKSSTINSAATTPIWSQSFEGNPSLSAGNNSVSVAGTDGTNTTATNTYQVAAVGTSTPTNLSFDQNGNMTSDGVNSYEWDAENRLIKIIYPGSGNNSQLTYDGAGRCARIEESFAGVTTSSRKFVWCDTLRCEIRDSADGIVSQYYADGVVSGATKTFYTKDHIGSIRECTNAGGSIQGQYSYDPFGRSQTLQGTFAADFQFGSHYRHERTGLAMTLFRCYNSNLGIWTNRDPLSGDSSHNLFSYVFNDPINLVDLFGLYPKPWFPNAAQFQQFSGVPVNFWQQATGGNGCVSVVNWHLGLSQQALPEQGPDPTTCWYGSYGANKSAIDKFNCDCGTKTVWTREANYQPWQEPFPSSGAINGPIPPRGIGSGGAGYNYAVMSANGQFVGAAGAHGVAHVYPVGVSPGANNVMQGVITCVTCRRRSTTTPPAN